MPPAKPAETAEPVADAVDTLSQQLKAAYEKGYAEGYKAAFPKPGIFEATRREVVKVQAPDEAAALRAIDAIMERKRAEYPDEKMPRQDRDILLEAWRKRDGRRRADETAPRAPRQASREPFEGEPVVEYEVVS